LFLHDNYGISKALAQQERSWTTSINFAVRIKKQIRDSEQHRPDIAQKRAEWKVMQLGLDPKKQVFGTKWEPKRT